MEPFVNAVKFLAFTGLYRLLALAGVMLAMIFAGGMARWFLATIHWIAGLLS